MVVRLVAVVAVVVALEVKRARELPPCPITAAAEPSILRTMIAPVAWLEQARGCLAAAGVRLSINSCSGLGESGAGGTVVARGLYVEAGPFDCSPTQQRYVAVCNRETHDRLTVSPLHGGALAWFGVFLAGLNYHESTHRHRPQTRKRSTGAAVLQDGFTMVGWCDGGSSFLTSVAIASFCFLSSGDGVRRRERTRGVSTFDHMVTPHICRTRTWLRLDS